MHTFLKRDLFAHKSGRNVEKYSGKLLNVVIYFIFLISTVVMKIICIYRKTWLFCHKREIKLLPTSKNEI